MRQLPKEFPDVSFHLDDSPVSIYKLSIPGEQDEPQVQNLYIKERNGKLTLLSHESAIISKIPKKVRTVRIFADGHEGILNQVREHARTIERTM